MPPLTQGMKWSQPAQATCRENQGVIPQRKMGTELSQEDARRLGRHGGGVREIPPNKGCVDRDKE